MSHSSHLFRYRLAVAGVLVCLYLIIMMGYVIWDSTRHVTPWALAAKGTSVFLEINEVDTIMRQFNAQGVFGQIFETQEAKAFGEGVEVFDSLRRYFPSWFDQKTVYLGYAPSASGHFDWGYYIHIGTGQVSNWKTILDQIAKQTDCHIQSSSFRGASILRLNQETKPILYSAVYKDFLIASRSRIIVEHAIAAALDQDGPFVSLTQSPDPKAAINACIDFAQLTQLLQSHFPQLSNSHLPWSETIGLLSLKLENGLLLWEGKYTSEILQAMTHSPPSNPIQLPPNTAFAIDFYLSPQAKEQYAALIAGDSTNSSLLELITGKVALVLQSERFADQAERILVLESPAPQQMLDLIPKKAFKSVEALKGYYRLDDPSFPRSIIGSLGSGFDRCYVTEIDGKICFGSSLKSLKEFATAQANKEDQNTHNPPSNLALWIDMENFWNFMIRSANPDAAASLSRNRRTLLSFKKIQLAFGTPDARINGEAQWINRDANPKSRKPSPLLLARSSTPISTTPTFFPNRHTGQYGIVVQNSGLEMMLITPSGQRKWTVTATEPITTDIQVVDLKGDRHHQILFATGPRIYLLDAKGKLSGAFPYTLPQNTKVDGLAIGDFNGAHMDAIMAISGPLGFGLTKYQSPLGNLSKLPLPAKPTSPPSIFRHQQKGYMLWVFDNGLVWLLDDMGQNHPGFPLDLSLEISNPPILFYSNDEASYLFKIIADNGEQIIIDLQGKIRERKILFRPHGDNPIQVALDPVGKQHFIIAEQSRMRMWFYDQNGKTLFTKSFLNPLPKTTQFFDYGNHAELIVVNEKDVKKTHLYFYDGEEVFERPLVSSQQVAASFDRSQGQFSVYKVRDNQLEVVRFKP